MHWKDFSAEKPKVFEVVLFLKPCLNKFGSRILRYDTGHLMDNGDVILHHDYEKPWEPESWLRLNLPFKKPKTKK